MVDITPRRVILSFLKIQALNLKKNLDLKLLNALKLLKVETLKDLKQNILSMKENQFSFLEITLQTIQVQV